MINNIYRFKYGLNSNYISHIYYSNFVLLYNLLKKFRLFPASHVLKCQYMTVDDVNKMCDLLIKIAIRNIYN